MSLIEEYIRLTKICYSTDYSDKNQVKKHNKSVDRMYEIVGQIADLQDDTLKEEFVKLLDITENETCIWAAVHILEKISVKEEIREKSLNIIRKYSEGNTVNAIGFRYWLKDFEGKN